MLYRNTVIPFDMHDKTLRMLFFGNYFGHTDIVIKSTQTGRVEGLIEDVLSDAEPDKIFGYLSTDISPLEPGEYEIYTTDYNHTERSRGVIITITGDSSMEQLARCSSTFHAEAEDYLEEEKLDLPKDLSALTYIHKLYREATSETKQMALAKLLMAAVDMLNKRIAKLDLTVEPMSYDAETELVTLDPEAVAIRRCELLTGKVQQVDAESENVRMPADYDGLYLYAALDEEGIPLNFCFSFCPDPVLYGFIKEDKNYAKQLYQNAVDKIVSFPEELVSFTDEEVPFLSVIRELQPGSSLFHAPRLVTEYGKTRTIFEEEDLKILKAFPETFYLSINPVEYALDKDQRINIPVTGGNISFYPGQMYISEGDYVYWVEDGYSHIMSDVKLARVHGGSINPNPVDQAENDDFNERLRKLNMYQYEKHLKPYASANYPDALSKIEYAISYCESAVTCSVSDAASTIIDQCLLYENKLLLPDIISAVMRDKTVYGDYVVKFFETPLRYKYDDFTLVLPPDSGVLYRLERYSYVNGRTVDYFASKKLEAIDYHFYDCDFAVFSAVDVRTGKSSGFLLFDFDYNREGRTKVTRFLIDALEVQK